MLIRPYACACALALSLPVATRAAAEDVVPKVEVAGARYDQRREETASSVVVGREELLRHGDRSLGEVLKRVPGITIGNGSGRTSDIRLRGLGNGYTQILLNGVAAPAGFSLESLAPELIERVEIVRAASAALGLQGIAGTVNIILRKSAGRARTTLKAGLETLRGRQSPSLDAEFGGKDEGFSYAVPVTLSRTARATAPLEEESGPGLRRTVRQRVDDVARVASMAPRANWTLANGDTVGLQGFVSANDRAIDFAASDTTLFGAPTRHPERGTVFDSTATWLRADLLWTRKLGEGVRIEAKGGISRSRRHSDFEFGKMEDGRRAAPLSVVSGDFRESGYHLGATYVRPFAGGHELTIGWDGAHARRAQTRIARDRDTQASAWVPSDDRYRGVTDRIGVFAQDSWDINPTWSLSAGVRWETLRTAVEDSKAAPVRRRSVIPGPVLQALYKPMPGHQLRAGLTRTYKAPTMFNLIPRRFTVDNNNSATNPHTEGNPRLLPEKAWGLDLGYDHNFGKEGLLAASAYLRRIDDVTGSRLFLDRGEWVSAPANQGRALARGVAFEAKLPVPGVAGAALNANLARNWSRVAQVPGPDNRIDGQVPLTASIGADYRAALTVGVSFTYARGAANRFSREWSESNGGTRDLDVYGLWGAGTPTRLRIGVTNLLGRAAVSGSRYGSGADMRITTLEIAPGTALRITFEHDFERTK